MKTLSAALAVTLLASPLLAQEKVDKEVEKAYKKLEEGKADDAVKTLDKLKKDFRTNPRVYDELARMIVRAEVDEAKFDRARAALKEGVANAGSPAEKADAHANLARFELLAGSGAAALEAAKAGVAAQETPGSLAALAMAQARVGDAAAALAAAQKAVGLGAQSAVAHEALGDASLSSGKAKEAEAAYRKAAQLAPTAPGPLAGLSRALLEQGRGSEAVAAGRQAIVADSTSGEAYAALGIALLEGEKNWNEAIAQAQQGKFLNPRSAPVLVAVAKIFEARQNHQQALLAYQDALKVDPAYGPALMAEVNAHIAKGDLDAAEAAALKLLQKAPKDPDLNKLIGQIRVRKGQHAAAIEPLRVAAEAMSGNHEVQALLGGTLYYAGQVEEAAEAYGRAVDLAPDNLSYRKDYGFILGLSGKVAEGIGQIEQVIGSNGYDDPSGFLAAGDLYLDADPKRPADAAKAYARVLSLDAKNPRAALGLGQASFAQKDYDAAITAFKKAIEIEPKVAATASSRIGWCYLAKEDEAQAEAWQKKAAAAGFDDTGLTKQIANLRKIKEGPQISEAQRKEYQRQQQIAADVTNLVNQYNRGDAPAKAQAVRRLVGLVGADAYDVLAHAISERDPRVKGAACWGLGQIGAAGKKSQAHVSAFVNVTPPVVIPDNEMEHWALVFEAQSACREALRRWQ